MKLTRSHLTSSRSSLHTEEASKWFGRKWTVPTFYSTHRYAPDCTNEPVYSVSKCKHKTLKGEYGDALLEMDWLGDQSHGSWKLYRVIITSEHDGVLCKKQWSSSQIHTCKQDHSLPGQNLYSVGYLWSISTCNFFFLCNGDLTSKFWCSYRSVWLWLSRSPSRRQDHYLIWWTHILSNNLVARTVIHQIGSL